MKNLVLALLFLPLICPAQGYIDLGTEGCNNYGGHGTQNPWKVQTENWFTANGMWYTVFGDNDTYGGSNPSLYHMGVYIQTSGSDVIDGPAELAFFNNCRSCKQFGHASAGDSERSFVNACGDIDEEYVTQGSGASLSNSSKHSNIRNELTYIVPGKETHPIFNGIAGTSWVLNDEWYWLGAGMPGRYWDPKNVVLVEIDEDGPHPDNNFNVPVVWEMVNDSGDINVSMSFGHTNGIVTPGDPRYEMWMNGLDYLNTSCTATPFNIELDEPDPNNFWFMSSVHNFIYFSPDSKINLKGFHPEFGERFQTYQWISVAGEIVEQGIIPWQPDFHANIKLDAPRDAYGVYIFWIVGTQYNKKVIIR